MAQPPVSEQRRNDLLLEHYELVRRIAYRLYHRLPKVMEAEDLVGAGVMGLFEAIERYEPDRGVPFESFAKHRIQGAIMDAMRGADWTPTSVRRKNDLLGKTRHELRHRLGREPSREEMSAHLDVAPDSYDALVTDSEIRTVMSLQAPAHDTGTATLADVVHGDEDHERDLTAEEVRALVRDAAEILPERERMAIDLHYYHEMRLREVGEQLGVTESRACQLCKQAIGRLRKRLQPHL